MNIYKAHFLMDADKTDFNPFQALIFFSNLSDAEKNEAGERYNIPRPTPEQIKANAAMLYIQDAYKKLDAAIKAINPVLYPSKHIQYKLYKSILRNGFRILKKVNPYRIKLSNNIYIIYEIDNRYHLYINGIKQ